MLLVNIANAQRFSIFSDRVKDPNGVDFVPIGANISGWNYHEWPHNAVAQANVIAEAWKFNTIKACIYLKATSYNGALTNGGKTWRNNLAERTSALDTIVIITMENNSGIYLLKISLGKLVMTKKVLFMQ